MNHDEQWRRVGELPESMREYLTKETDRQLQEMRQVIDGLAGLVARSPEVTLTNRLRMLGLTIEQEVAQSAIPLFAAMAIEMLAEQRGRTS